MVGTSDPFFFSFCLFVWHGTKSAPSKTFVKSTKARTKDTIFNEHTHTHIHTGSPGCCRSFAPQQHSTGRSHERAQGSHACHAIATRPVLASQARKWWLHPPHHSQLSTRPSIVAVVPSQFLTVVGGDVCSPAPLRGMASWRTTRGLWQHLLLISHAVVAFHVSAKRTCMHARRVGPSPQCVVRSKSFSSPFFANRNLWPAADVAPTCDGVRPAARSPPLHSSTE
jgi:hypothetical protein